MKCMYVDGAGAKQLTTGGKAAPPEGAKDTTTTPEVCRFEMAVRVLQFFLTSDYIAQ